MLSVQVGRSRGSSCAVRQTWAWGLQKQCDRRGPRMHMAIMPTCFVRVVLSTRPSFATEPILPPPPLPPPALSQFYNEYSRALQTYMSKSEGVGMDLTLVGAWLVCVCVCVC